MGVQILLKLRWFKSEEGTLGCLFFFLNEIFGLNKINFQWIITMNILIKFINIFVERRNSNEER
ncbi:hypothetical protein CDB3_19620 [Bacillus sp. CDB3]|nr:hypothetical protein CDB3_19620 [Bacillus sp. CDB3]